MNISPDLIQKFDSLKSGKVYYGELAKDSSEHAAVVVSVFNGMVNYFCFTSQELTIKRYTDKDPKASVTLAREETNLFFPNSEKATYIYCGRSNLGQVSESEFLEKLSSGQFVLKCELPADLFERIKNAIKSSKTMTPKLLAQIGLL